MKSTARTSATPDTDKPLSPRKLVRRAKELVREAKTLLKKKRKRVSPEAHAAATTATERLVSAIPGRGQMGSFDRPELEQATIALDDRLRQHFGKWRKSATRELLEAILWALGLAAIIRVFLIEAFSIPSSSMLPTLHIGDRLFVDKISYGLYVPFSPERMVEWNQPEPGNIIVFRYEGGPPSDPTYGEDYIKRVVGGPGDTIQVTGGYLYRNGERVAYEDKGATTCPVYADQDVHVADCPCTVRTETLSGNTYTTQWMDRKTPDTNPRCPGVSSMSRDTQLWTVPPGHVFVMGDNRDQSSDSRMWSPGKHFVRYDRIKGSAFVIWWGNIGLVD